MILASSIGKIVHPIFIAFATVLQWYYALIPNYAIAIALLTVTVMIVVFPITRKMTRSMMKMQLLAPELKKIQAKHKAQPTATVAEKSEMRQRLNEEMMALYKENGVSPTGGCLPMFLQFPIFIILYDTIKALTHKSSTDKLQPLYIGHHSKLYYAITHSNGNLKSFGINLADSVRTAGLSWGAKAPMIALILVAIALQYYQIKQLSGRNPAAAQGNPQMQQMQQMQKFFPIIFGIIYIAIPAGVNVYFIVSNLFRIGQQGYMYRHDPHITASMEKLRAQAKSDPKVVEAKLKLQQEAAGKRGGLLSRFLPAGPAALPEAASSNGKAANSEPAKGTTKPRGSANKNSPSSGGNTRRAQPRAQGKRQRRPR